MKITGVSAAAAWSINACNACLTVTYTIASGVHIGRTIGHEPTAFLHPVHRAANVVSFYSITDLLHTIKHSWQNSNSPTQCIACLEDQRIEIRAVFNENFEMILRLNLSHTVTGLLSSFRKREAYSALPFSSDRQHLSYDGCLEVRGEIFRTVLCCIVYWSCAQS